jgi:hypothetical protein
MFLGTSRGPGGVAADGEANETREMPARVVQEAPIAAVRMPVESRPTPKRAFIIPAQLSTQTDCAKNALASCRSPMSKPAVNRQ